MIFDANSTLPRWLLENERAAARDPGADPALAIVICGRILRDPGTDAPTLGSVQAYLRGLDAEATQAMVESTRLALYSLAEDVNDALGDVMRDEDGRGSTLGACVQHRHDLESRAFALHAAGYPDLADELRRSLAEVDLVAATLPDPDMLGPCVEQEIVHLGWMAHIARTVVGVWWLACALEAIADLALVKREAAKLGRSAGKKRAGHYHHDGCNLTPIEDRLCRPLTRQEEADAADAYKIAFDTARGL